MAKAKLSPPAEPTIILELSKEEAEALAAVSAKIRGHYLKSPRRHLDSVLSALEEVGIHYDKSPHFDLWTKGQSLWVQDYPGA